MADTRTESLGRTVTEHISRHTLEAILAQMTQRSWKAMDESAREFERSGEIAATELANVIAVAGRMLESGTPFPQADVDLYVTMNQAAEQIPHR